MAIFTQYMYSIMKVISNNCHLVTQPGDLGLFKGCYSVTSFKRRQWHLLVWIDWNQSRNGPKSGTKSLTKNQTSRSAEESHIELRRERNVIRLRNPTKDKRPFRRMLTSADPYSSYWITSFEWPQITRLCIYVTIIHYHFPYWIHVQCKNPHTYISHLRRRINIVIYYPTIMSFYHIRSRECAKYEAVIIILSNISVWFR